MDNAPKGEQGEHVFPQSMPMGTPSVNQGHNPASAPVVEFGGENPRDYSKTNGDSI